MKKILALFLTIAMLFTSYAFVLPAYAVDSNAPQITDAQLTLGADLAVQYFVPAQYFGEDGYTNPVLHASIGSVNQTVSEYTLDSETNCYVFRVDYITPAMMSDKINVYLTAKNANGTDFTGETKSKSIAELCDDYINDGDAKTADLADAILSYGYASQMYVKGSSDLTNANTEIFDVLGSLKKTGTTVKGALSEDAFSGTVSATWQSGSLTLTDSIVLNFTFQTTENVDGLYASVVYGHGGTKEATVTEFASLGSNSYKLSFDAWSACDFSAPVAITLYKGTKQVSKTVHYSILDYAISAEETNDAKLKNLTRSILKYITYVDNLSPVANYDIPHMKDVCTRIIEGEPAISLTTATYYPNATNVKHLGRTYVGNNTTWLGWSGAGIEFTFFGTDLSINIEGDDTITQPDPWNNGGFTTASGNVPRYAIYLDGVKVVDEIMLYATSNKTHTILAGGEAKQHTVKVVKLSDAGTFNIGVKAIKVTSAEGISATSKGSMLIEFIGDSITSGSAVDADGKAKYPNSTTGAENALLSYGYLTAQKLGADYSIVSMPGYGIAIDSSKRISTFYTYSVAKGGAMDGTATKTNHNFGSGADYVVINLGTNDGSSAQATFESEYVNFLKTIRSKNPNATIICTMGTMSYKTYDYIVNAVNTYKSSTGDTNIFTYKMTTAHANGPVDAHPSAKTHEGMATELAAYIAKIEDGTITPEEPTEPDTPAEPDEPAGEREQPTWTASNSCTYENGVLTSPVKYRTTILTPSDNNLKGVESIIFDFGDGFYVGDVFIINYSDGASTTVPSGTKRGEYTVAVDPTKTIVSLQVKIPDTNPHTFGITLTFAQGSTEPEPELPDADGLVEATYELTTSNVKYLGRTYRSNTGALWLSYSGTGMEFEFTGTSVTINLQGADGLQYWGDDTNMPRYAIYIDGELMVDRVMSCLNAGGSVLTASHTFDGLRYVKHTVKVLKLSSANAGDLAITKLAAKSSTGVTPTAEKDLKIEFVGDSITCGYGVEGLDKSEAYKSATENITKTYGYIAAQGLDADATFACIGGYGVVSGYVSSSGNGNATTENVMSIYYTKLGNKGGGNKWQGVQASSVNWSFEDDVDIVVINLGTNDSGYVNHANGNPTTRKAEFEAKYVELLQLVRQKRPNAHIICTLGTMNQDLWTNIQNAVNTFKSKGGSNVSTYSLGTAQGSEGYGSGWHPSAATQARAGGLLKTYIQGLISNGTITR